MKKNNTEIDEVKIRRMLSRILLDERKNSKTKQLNVSDMVSKIQKIIEEELECL
ncbi:hypothetical protein [Clostridium butyricum]|uniref:hypothetical protein n=2 Tax=Clostridium TaxID=1485 RepID=UPI002AB1EE16|nr:hypothetical protein [Clostridium butyricum]